MIQDTLSRGGLICETCYNRDMKPSFYFYDLETSGLNPRSDRIMQFAGQRTDLDFNPIGEPQNILVQLADDTLPSPSAVMVTGITPQATLQDGMTEPEFCQFLIEEIATPNTTIVGYNSVRFDDEFVRHTLWRNFYDPYEWQWRDGRSRWDLLDVVRLTRALRPEGIRWPVTEDGHSTNRLELLTKLNGIEHAHAHDALADVVALIEVAKLIKTKQPQLFEFLYKLRGKREVENLANLKNPRPFVYASGRYPSEFEKTTVAFPLAMGENGSILVYDLRYNLDDLLEAEAAARDAGMIDFEKPWCERDPWEKNYLPIVKKLQYNHCPAIAPLVVLDKDDGWKKIKLDKTQIQQNLQCLLKHPEFAQRMASSQKRDFGKAIDAESALYDGFLDDRDRLLCTAVRNNVAEDLANFRPAFHDERLPELLLHYKARSFPASLDNEETSEWEKYRRARLARQLPQFMKELQWIGTELAKNQGLNGKSCEECQYLAEELKLWCQSIAPGE